MVIVYVVMALVGAGLAVFVVQNLGTVEVIFLVWRVQGMPLALVILLALFTGMVLAWVGMLGPNLRLRARIRALERQRAHPASGAEPTRSPDSQD